MKKLLLSSVIAVSGLFALSACTNVGAATEGASYHSTQTHMQHKNHKQNPFSELNLTATQQAQIQAIRENNRGERMKNHDAMMQVLTAEQRAQLTKLKAERQALRQSKGARMDKGQHMNNGKHMSRGQYMHKGQPMSQ